MSLSLYIGLRLATHRLFEELGRRVVRDGSQECPNCGAIKALVEHVLFECASYDSQRQKIFDYLKLVLPPDAFDPFLRSSNFDKGLFCLRERKGLLVNDECSSWYSRIGEFLMSAWDRRKEILYGSELAEVVGWANPTPDCEANVIHCYDS